MLSFLTAKNTLPPSASEAIATRCAKLEAMCDSIKRHVAWIEFTPDGTVLEVNDLFLGVIGYRKEEVLGNHHRMFCDKHYAESADYREFWRKLQAGEAFSNTFSRRHKSGEVLWLEATYIPITEKGCVERVVKIAHDVTATKNLQDEFSKIQTSLDKSMALIEFSVDGVVRKVNQNFLQVMGYREQDVIGKHHKMFCYDDFYQANPTFWKDIASGAVKQGVFHRRNQQDHDIWLEATYTPIVNEEGKVTGAIKLATDLTLRIKREQGVQAIVLSTSEETVQISERAKQVLQDTVAMAEDISSGVDSASELLAKLQQQSQQITNIVTTIESIADQTNLLALNAAIEAARAGEHGRGFAVVADEVRSLAGRTSKSTVEIESLVRENERLTTEATSRIQTIQHKAGRSKELINEAGTIMEEVRQGAQSVAKTLSERL